MQVLTTAVVVEEAPCMQVLTTAVVVEEAPCMQVLTTAVVVEEALGLPASVEAAAAADVASVEEAADMASVEEAAAADMASVEEAAVSQEPAAGMPTTVAAETKTFTAPPAGRTVRKFKRPTR